MALVDEKLYNPFSLKWGEEISFPSTKNADEFGNRVYNRYPARSVFFVPRAILNQHRGENLRVLDPFMGSGTTAVETVLSGNIPLGVEMDPFARMIASVSSTTYNERELKTLKRLYEKVQRNWITYEPAEKPDLAGIDRWFGDGVLNQLLQLKAAIIKETSKKYLPFMLVTFADCIKPVSLMERQSLKPYISKKFSKKTKSVNESFEASFNAHFAAISSMSCACGLSTPIEWIGFDATVFTTQSNSVDIAISSPPYINALDYTRCIKIESALCGTINNAEVSALHKKQVGHEARRKQKIEPTVKKLFNDYFEKISQADPMRGLTALAYFNDMYNNLRNVYSALKKGGCYHLIVGDNTIRNLFVPTHEILAKLGESIGFEWTGYYKYRIKDHRMSIPRNGQSCSKIEYEHVVILRK